MNILNVVLLVIAAATVGLGIYLWYQLVQNKEQNKTPLIWLVWPSQKTHGRFIGLQKDIQRHPSGDRLRVTISPKDVDTTDPKYEKEPVKDEPFIIRDDRVTIFPRGTLSKEADIAFALPNSVQEMPEKFRNSVFGAAFEYALQTIDYTKQRVEILQQKINDRDTILKEIGSPEYSKELMEKQKGFMIHAADMMLEAKEAKKKSDSFGVIPQQGTNLS